MRFILVCMMILLLASTGAENCLAWGAITHAHLSNVLGERYDLENLQEMYGSTIPDMFNLIMDSPYSDHMYQAMHYRFDEIRPYACTKLLEAAMMGIASHNDAWGADWTAHHQAQSLTDPIGYVVFKEGQLAPVLEPQLAGLLASAGVPNAGEIAADMAPGLAHNFIETAVDLLISRNEDPFIGYRLLISSQLRAPGIPFMVARAFARDLAAHYGISRFRAWLFIVYAEREYRELMKMYGGIFTKGFDEAVALLAEQGALYAEKILHEVTGVNVTVPPEMVGGFLVDFAIPAVQDDYSTEIAMTCDYLDERLESEGYTAAPAPFLARSDERVFETAPAEPRLEQNHPNPFNPSTTIRFSIPENAGVRIAVFDASGRRVAVLLDRMVEAGDHSVVWDGIDSRGNAVCSGIYFCRMECGTVSFTKKMILLR
jgi:hypothetical protein